MAGAPLPFPHLPAEVHVALLRAAPDAILAVNPAGLIAYANDATERVFGYAPEALVGQPIELLVPAAKRARHAAQRQGYADAPAVRTMGSRLGITGATRDGREIPLDISLSPIATELGSFVVCVARDVTEQRAMEDRLRELSFRDALTGLYSRVFFDAELERLDASRSFPVTCFMFDVDLLKEVNDTHGHAAGDALLRRAADLLRGCFRSGEILARLGGDEFAAIVPSMDAAMAGAVRLRVRDAMLGPLHADEPRVSLSIGLATATAPPLREALAAADRDMYAAKRSSYPSSRGK